MMTLSLSSRNPRLLFLSNRLLAIQVPSPSYVFWHVTFRAGILVKQSVEIIGILHKFVGKNIFWFFIFLLNFLDFCWHVCWDYFVSIFDQKSFFLFCTLGATKALGPDSNRLVGLASVFIFVGEIIAPPLLLLVPNSNRLRGYFYSLAMIGLVTTCVITILMIPVRDQQENFSYF